jgi:hypothetical protein
VKRSNSAGIVFRRPKHQRTNVVKESAISAEVLQAYKSACAEKIMLN